MPAAAEFERFFSELGEPTEQRSYPATPPALPPMDKFMAACGRFDTRFLPPDGVRTVTQAAGPQVDPRANGRTKRSPAETGTSSVALFRMSVSRVSVGLLACTDHRTPVVWCR